MPGLIQTAQQASTNPLDPDAPKLSATGYEADQITIDERKDTVAGRLEGIIAKNSPLMRQAHTRGLQQANQRGLLNSSMAGQAAQAAVIDRATPIASQDANTSYDANKTNVGAINAANQFTAQGQQQLEQIGANVAGQQAIATNAGNIDSRLQAERGDIDSTLQGERGDIDSRLQAERGGIDSTLQRERGDIELELQRGDLASRATLLEMQGQIDSRLLAERADIDLALQTAEGAIREQLLARQGEIDGQLATLQGEINAGLQQREAELQQQLDNNKGDIEAQQILLRNEGAKELANVEYQWRSLLQSNQSAAYFFAEMSNSIGNILANPDIPATAKTGLINQQRVLLSDGLRVIGAVGNLDLVGVLGGGSPNTGSGGGPSTIDDGGYLDWLDQFRAGGLGGLYGGGGIGV